MRFVKKPVEIDAIEFTGYNTSDIEEFMDRRLAVTGVNGRVYLNIHTLEGDFLASPGDWIIRGIRGEYYPCKPDIFAKSYERVE
jgi:hypothetical protein